MPQQITTIRLADDLRERVNNLAAVTGRSMNYHIQRAVEEYVDRQMWQVGHVGKALVQARAGQGMPLHDYVERSVADGTLSRENYEREVAHEMADAQAADAWQ